MRSLFRFYVPLKKYANYQRSLLQITLKRFRFVRNFAFPLMECVSGRCVFFSNFARRIYISEPDFFRGRNNSLHGVIRALI